MFGVLGTAVDAPKLGVVRGLENDGAPAMIVVSKISGAIVSIQREGAEGAAALLEADGMEVIKLGKREFLLPGFVDCHVHCSQWPYMGTGIDKPLMADDGFLQKYAFPSESSLNRETGAAVYSAAIDDMLRNGTTTALVFGSAGLEASEAFVAAAIERGGPRSLLGKVNMDRHCPDHYVETTAQSLADTEAFIEITKAANAALKLPEGSPPIVAPVVTPRFLPTCTPELLRGLGALAEKHNCFVQSHLSESCDELAFSSSLFPDFESDAAAFAEFGLLRSNMSLMAHCVHLQPGEAELMMLHGCSMAHCPTSNFFFAKEALPVRQLVQLGVKVGLGTDVAGGYSPSMLLAIRHAVLASKTLQFRRASKCVFECGAGGVAARLDADSTDAGAADGAAASPPLRKKAKPTRMPGARKGFHISFDPNADEATLRERHNLTHLEALHLATQAGADALGMGESLGSLDVGKRFDAIVLSATAPTIREYKGGVAEDASDVLHKLLTLGDDRNVTAVFVGGKKVV